MEANGSIPQILTLKFPDWLRVRSSCSCRFGCVAKKMTWEIMSACLGAPRHSVWQVWAPRNILEYRPYRIEWQCWEKFTQGRRRLINPEMNSLSLNYPSLWLLAPLAASKVISDGRNRSLALQDNAGIWEEDCLFSHHEGPRSVSQRWYIFLISFRHYGNYLKIEYLDQFHG